MMENEGATNIIGNPALPYVTSLANDYGSATQSYALTHPSLPNYLDIISGSNQGVTDDNPPSDHSFPAVPDPRRPAGGGGRQHRRLRREPAGRSHQRLGALRRAPQPVGVLPERADHGQGLLGAHPRPEQRVAAGLRVVHPEPDRRRSHRSPHRHPCQRVGRHRELPVELHSVRAGDVVVPRRRADHHRVGRGARQRHVRGQRWRRRARPHHRRVEEPGGEPGAVLGRGVDGGDPPLDRDALPGALPRRCVGRRPTGTSTRCCPGRPAPSARRLPAHGRSERRISRSPS